MKNVSKRVEMLGRWPPPLNAGETPAAGQRAENLFRAGIIVKVATDATQGMIGMQLSALTLDNYSLSRPKPHAADLS